MVKLGYIAAVFCLCAVIAPATASARDADLAQAQLHLLILGYEPGPVDGAMGGRTLSALDAFHADRGGSFDGTFDRNDTDALYDALAEVPFNGSPPQLDAKSGLTDQRPRAMDFVPEVDLSSLYEPLTALNPGAFGDQLRSASFAPDYCGYRGVAFPEADRQLQTYSSFREFETTGRRAPFAGNNWIDEISFAILTTAPAAALGDPEAIAALKAALLSYADAGTLLDSANLVGQDGKAIVVTDFNTGVLAAQSYMANYLLARDRLELNADEQARIERWLTRLFETYPDNSSVLSPGLERVSQEVARVGRSLMLHSLMVDDVAGFNEGARLALIAHSFVRADGSERSGASRGNRALYYQGAMFMNAMETYIILQSQGVDAATILGPTIQRMADFWGRAWHDHTVLHPYAMENEGVFVGSDYKVQDRIEVSPGVDPFLAIWGDADIAPRLLEARETYPHRTQIGEVFVITCMAQVLGDYHSPASVGGGPIDMTAVPGGLGGIESSAAFTVDNANITSGFSEDQFSEYTVTAFKVNVDDHLTPLVKFRIFADYAGQKSEVENLDLLRAVFARTDLKEESSRTADYSSCDETAVRVDGAEQQLRLHWGFSSEYNACILDKMHENDRRYWSAIMVNFETILDAAAGKRMTDQLRELHTYANR